MTQQILTCEQALQLVPQKPPFRFVDEYLELSENHAVSRYTFRNDEFFYQGHFPHFPLTPGVILLEAMGQAAQAISFYRKTIESGRESLHGMVAVFSDAQIEVLDQVRPGDRITCRAELIYNRMGKMKSKVEMRKDDGTLVATGTTSGMAVKT